MITLSPYGFGEGNWVDSERPVLGAGDFPACPLYDLPPAPGPRTIPLPPTSWGYLSDSYEAKDSDAHQFPLEGMGVSAQEAESSTSLAAAKPEIIENNDQSEVSNIFTPLEIMLYNNDLGSIRAVPLLPVRGAVTTAPETLKGNNSVSPRSATR